MSEKVLEYKTTLFSVIHPQHTYTVSSIFTMVEGKKHISTLFLTDLPTFNEVRIPCLYCIYLLIYESCPGSLGEQYVHTLFPKSVVGRFTQKKQGNLSVNCWWFLYMWLWTMNTGSWIMQTIKKRKLKGLQLMSHKMLFLSKSEYYL